MGAIPHRQHYVTAVCELIPGSSSLSKSRGASVLDRPLQQQSRFFHLGGRLLWYDTNLNSEIFLLTDCSLTTFLLLHFLKPWAVFLDLQRSRLNPSSLSYHIFFFNNAARNVASRLLHLPELLTSQAPCIYQLDLVSHSTMALPQKVSLWNLM